MPDFSGKRKASEGKTPSPSPSQPRMTRSRSAGTSVSFTQLDFQTNSDTAASAFFGQAARTAQVAEKKARELEEQLQIIKTELNAVKRAQGGHDRRVKEANGMLEDKRREWAEERREWEEQGRRLREECDKKDVLIKQAAENLTAQAAPATRSLGPENLHFKAPPSSIEPPVVQLPAQ
ncbi:hypothetical protein CF327_g7326 [Tilletia walkeri]|nr:hypothetical protein CF327_g7326 [Tilletia walkeri]